MKSCEKKREELICTPNISKIIYTKYQASRIHSSRRISTSAIVLLSHHTLPLFHREGPRRDAASSIRSTFRFHSPLIPPPRLFIGGGESRSSAGNRVRPPFLLPSHPTLWFPPILIPPRSYFSTDPTSSSFVFLPFFPLHRGDCSSLRDRIFT